MVGVHLITAGECILPVFYERYGFKKENEVILMGLEFLTALINSVFVGILPKSGFAARQTFNELTNVWKAIMKKNFE